MLTQQLVRELFDYDALTGVLTRRIPKGNTTAGVSAYVNHGSRYYRVCIYSRYYAAHRIIWLWIYGTFPKNEIDHINGNSFDNRLCNLREATRTENCQNTRRRKTNTSGKIGVGKCKITNKWRAYITVNRKYIALGYYKNIQDAIAARLAAEKKYQTFRRIYE